MALASSYGRAPAIIAEATKKSDLIWLGSGDWLPTAAWHVWHDDSAWVVTGPGEQPLPSIRDLPTAAVTVRSKDNLNRVVTWEALVWRITPDSEEWAEVVPLLLAKRLNLPDSEGAAARWAAECTVIRLEPTGRLLEVGNSLPSDSGALPPRRTPATTSVKVPFTLGRRRRV
ncbi:MAG: hypothetical protein M3O55_00875 [Actinomycetota bacterium]|nr:hypothetical protein [Actinomycetota bacterium]